MYKHSATKILFSAFSMLLLISCSSPTPGSESPDETFTPPSEMVPPAETPLVEETSTPAAIREPVQARPQYVLDLHLNYSTKAAEVMETIIYPNWTGETLNSLVLAVEPNLWNGGFSLKSLTIDELPIANYTLEPSSQRLEIPLLQPLPPGSSITITINYGLVLPSMAGYGDQNDVRPQIYGFSERQLNLVEWYPFVVPYVPGKGWILHSRGITANISSTTWRIST